MCVSAIANNKQKNYNAFAETMCGLRIINDYFYSILIIYILYDRSWVMDTRQNVDSYKQYTLIICIVGRLNTLFFTLVSLYIAVFKINKLLPVQWQSIPLERSNQYLQLYIVLRYIINLLFKNKGLIMIYLFIIFYLTASEQQSKIIT